MIASTVISLVVYITAVLAQGSCGGVKVGNNSWSNQVVTLHNQYRAQYGAQAVTWSQSRYTAALAYAEQCDFKHSDGRGQYGENLYAASFVSNISDALQAWMDEAPDYDYNNPGFSKTAMVGHFTQVVWKSTTEVGCALANCPANDTSHYIVCQYTPPGNFIGRFAQNVGKHI